MSTVKELLFEKEEEAKDRKIAEFIGITYDDLLETGPDIFEIKNDDGCVLDTVIKFSKNTPKRIINRIGNLDKESYQCSIHSIVTDLYKDFENNNDPGNIDSSNMADLF